jgi:sulfofructose kinase
MTAVLCVGLTTVDVVQRVTEFPEPGEKIQSVSADLVPGGPAANAASAVAALGNRAMLLTALGSDPVADLAKAGLTRRGVDVRDVIAGTSRGPSLSMVVVRERDGERTVVSRNAAEVELPATVDGLRALVAQADVLLLDGHLGALARLAAREAKNVNLPVVLDAGSWKPVLHDLLPLVDVAACSSAFSLSEQELHARGVPLVIRTNGAEPVTWSRGASTGQQAVAAVRARDTNGAGDVWHGALAVAVARGDGVEDAIRWANDVAAVRVQNTVGTWVEELERWRQDNG